MMSTPTSRKSSQIQAPTATQWVLRFTRTERAAHWVQAVTFLALLGTGLAISLEPVEAVIGHRAVLRELHLISAFFFVAGPSLIALAGNRWSVVDDAGEIDRWTAGDARWLLRPRLKPHRDTPAAGKFNAGQKLNAIFTLYATFAFGLTGLILWQNRRFPIGVVAQANTIHTYLAYFALAVFLGHIYLAAIHRRTRHALHGMLFGTVRREWTMDHHPNWRSPRGEGPIDCRTILRSAILLLAGLEGALLLARALLESLGANDTDFVTRLIYTASALPATIGHHVTGRGANDLGALLWAGLLAIVWFRLRPNKDTIDGTTVSER